MTPLLLLTVMTAGAFAFTITLWVTAFGTTSSAATARLMNLRNGASAANQPVHGTGASLRKRAGVTLAGINLVSVNAAANWQKGLERAGLTLTTKEYLILRGVIGLVIAAVIFFAIPAFPLAASAGLPVGWVLVAFWVKRRISSRRHKLESQMVELLQMVASGLRAGFGLIQAFETAADQLPEPLSVELRRLRDISVGSSVEDALEALNIRVGSSDFDIVITAVLIQRSVGGNLAEILDNVAHTMRERERIRGEIRTLTSQQRLTGYVIAGIPWGLGGIFFLTSPDFTSLLFTDPLGRFMLVGALVLEGLGFLVIRKIVNIEV